VYDGQKLLLIVVKLIGRLIVSLLSTNIKLLYTSLDLLTGRLLMMYDILLQHLFLCYSSCVKSVVGFFYMIGVNIMLLVNLIMTILPDKYFKTVF